MNGKHSDIAICWMYLHNLIQTGFETCEGVRYNNKKWRWRICCVHFQDYRNYSPPPEQFRSSSGAISEQEPFLYPTLVSETWHANWFLWIWVNWNITTDRQKMALGSPNTKSPWKSPTDPLFLCTVLQKLIIQQSRAIRDLCCAKCRVYWINHIWAESIFCWDKK